MDIALFDLDHTLIPFDSGAVFTRHLAERGALPPEFEAQYLEYCLRYAAGTVDMVQMHRFTVGALAVHDPATLARWLDEFRHLVAPRIPQRARQLVQQHQAAGHACFREHKLVHVRAWLARRGLAWGDVGRSWFYSDSCNDLPLLQAVTDPVAVDPDARLHAFATARGWPVLSLREP